jgi:hypothetical protein
VTTAPRRPGRRIIAWAEAGWPSLLRSIDEVAANWNEGVAGLAAAEAAPGARDDEAWGAWHVLNHVAAYLEAATEVMRSLTRGENVDYPGPQKWLGDGVPLAAVRERLDGGWESYLRVVGEAAEAPETDATVTHVLAGTMSAREWAALGVYHLGDHVQQLRQMRGLDPADAG